MSSENILLIDDDKTLLELLAEHISMAGYDVITANTGRAGIETAEKHNPDLVVLDVMMPGTSGWEVCKHLRRSSHVPIIMLTAKGEEFDKLRGFHLGVDDYVTKPFSFAELVARIRAVLARSQAVSGSGKHLTSGKITIDFEQHKVVVAEKIIDLSPTEYRLLEALARRANRTVPTDQLVREVWGPQYLGETEHVKRYIWALRKKIENDPGNPEHILTERGFGYRFE